MDRGPRSALLIWHVEKKIELFAIPASELTEADENMLWYSNGRRLQAFLPEEDVSHTQFVLKLLGLLACRVADKDAMARKEPMFVVSKRPWEELFPLVAKPEQEVGAWRKYLVRTSPDDDIPAPLPGNFYSVIISGLC